MTRPGAVVVVSVVALVFAGLASWGVYNYLQQETQKSKSAQVEQIVVAAADIPIGVKLNATHLKSVSWPKESLPQGGFAVTSQLIDRIAIRPIGTGEAITEQKLLPKDIKGGAGMMTYAVPAGHRAVTVGVNEVAGVAGFLSTNNRVDIVLTTQIPGANPPDTISKIILQDVPLLATGQIATEQKDGKPVVVPTVTLDLTPEDCEKLILATSKGSLQMLLRGVADLTPTNTTGATITKVLSGVDRGSPKVTIRKKASRSPAVVKAATATTAVAPSFSVELLKGANRSSRQFISEQ